MTYNVFDGTLNPTLLLLDPCWSSVLDMPVGQLINCQALKVLAHASVTEIVSNESGQNATRTEHCSCCSLRSCETCLMLPSDALYCRRGGEIAAVSKCSQEINMLLG